MKRSLLKRILSLKKYSQRKHILIYQMGKVASTTLERSIPGSIHFHSLYGNTPTPLAMLRPNDRILRRTVSRLRLAVIRALLKRADDITMISLVRDPLERNIAMFFQGLPFWLISCRQPLQGKPPTIISTREEGFDVLFRIFNERFEHDYPLAWFDREIKRFCRIDVFDEPFDVDRGYGIYQKGKYKLIVIRIEQLASVWPDVAKEIGLPVTLKMENCGDNKWYGDLYKRFRRTYRCPPDIARILYTSRYATKFFSQEEINKRLGNKPGVSLLD